MHKIKKIHSLYVLQEHRWKENGAERIKSSECFCYFESRSQKETGRRNRNMQTFLGRQRHGKCVTESFTCHGPYGPDNFFEINLWYCV